MKTLNKLEELKKAYEVAYNAYAEAISEEAAAVTKAYDAARAAANAILDASYNNWHQH